MVLVENLFHSTGAGSHRKVIDIGFFFLCCGIMLICSLFFAILEDELISASSLKNEAARLDIFDRRFGYGAAEVHSTLQAWGMRGRLLYLIIELLDGALYIFAFRGAFLVLYNRMANVIEDLHPKLSLIAHAMTYIPILIGFFDMLENMAHVIMTLHMATTSTSFAWILIVRFGSTMNTLKWTAFYLCQPLFFVQALAVFIMVVGAACRIRKQE
mmetsp:Transcript_71435/g.190789  ORF Transcript_71435/g.190789 Transcript_71435/m.190789 type:complete len:214 (+) Transcript_71435:10-651(+)